MSLAQVNVTQGEQNPFGVIRRVSRRAKSQIVQFCREVRWKVRRPPAAIDQHTLHDVMGVLVDSCGRAQMGGLKVIGVRVCF